MNNIVIHPSCFVCENCHEVKLKKELMLFQDQEGHPINFCKECGTSLIESVNVSVGSNKSESGLIL